MAVWSAPNHRVCRGHYVLDRRLTLTDPGIVNSTLAKRLKFITSSPNHMILRPGSGGRAFVHDAFGDAVCVAGKFGKGKVVFSGCFYGYFSPGQVYPFGDATERRLFFDILNWLLR